MKHITTLCLGFLTLLAFNAQAQNSSDFWNGLDTTNVQDYRTLIGNIFGQLNTSQYPSGLLFNRTSGTSRIPELRGQSNSPEIIADDWFMAYDAISWSHVVPNQGLPIGHEMYAEIMENYDKTFSEDEFWTVPIGIMDFSYHRLRDDAVTSGYLNVANNGYLSHASGAGNPFEAHDFFAAAALADTVDSDTIHWELDSLYHFGNQSQQVIGLEVDFDDGNGWTQVNVGGIYSIGYGTPGDIHLKLKMTYANGSRSRAAFRVYNEADGSSRSGGKPDEEWTKVVTGNVSGHKYKAKVGIWFGCGNSTKKCRKPAIFVTGFNPIPKSFKKFYAQFNQAGLYTQLREEGWDVIIVKWSKGVGYIQDNAEALIDVIDRINDEKMGYHGRHFENVVTGYSQGGLIARYCLSWMEKQLFEGLRTRAHHCRTYFSYEGEHQGANVMLGTQLAMQGLLTTTAPLSWVFGYGIVVAAHSIYGSKASRQLAKYHRSQMSGTAGQGPDPLRTIFMNSMLNDFNHVATHPEKRGYPALSRLVGVASGSSVGTKFILQEGEKLYQKTFGAIASPLGQLFPGPTDRIAYYALDRDPNSVVFQQYHGFGWMGFIFPTYSLERKTMGALPYDDAPGGIEGKGQHRRIAGVINLSLLWPLGGTNIDRSECFTPTLSTFDIRNHNGGPDLAYNVNAFDLFRTSPGIDNPNYGYPHIEHGINRFDYTPFDALAATDSNDEHVKPEPGVLKEFMRNEISPHHLTLQNRKIGQYHYSYRADFEARQTITLGKEVTWHTERDWIQVLPTGELNCMAGDFVDMKPGFEAEYGSAYEAWIGGMTVCSFKETGAESANEEEAGVESQATSGSFSEEEKFSLFPNPSEGRFQLRVPGEESWMVQVYDLNGRLVWDGGGEEVERVQIDLSKQPKGIYMLTVVGANEAWRTRMVLQ